MATFGENIKSRGIPLSHEESSFVDPRNDDISPCGCIGGESGTVEVELTDEQINDLFDEHFQDFVHNSSVTHNEYVSNNYNGSGSSTTQYFVVDHIFTKSDLYGVSPAVDYMNNTFEVVYSEYNYSTNQYTNPSINYPALGIISLDYKPLQFHIGTTQQITNRHGWITTIRQLPICMKITHISPKLGTPVMEITILEALKPTQTMLIS